MNNTQQTPFIPDTAPFTPEQRSWLNGFFAGLYSRSTQAAPELSVPKKKLTILFGSQTGSAEELAKQFGTQGNQKGLQTTVYDMQDYPVEKLTEEENLLIVTSTHGQCDMPDNAQSFWEFLNSDKALKLDHLNFSVLALGDTNYVDSFCAAGKNFDRRLEELGAKRISQRINPTNMKRFPTPRKTPTQPGYSKSSS